MDSFEVEAVSLGHLKRIIVGHDGTGPGKEYEAIQKGDYMILETYAIHITRG